MTPRRSSATGRATESSSVGAFVCDNKKERRVADLAIPFLGSKSAPVSWDEKFIVSNEVGHAATTVASVATRNEIGEVVVHAVAIQVVGDESATASLPTGDPVDCRIAPVACVRPPADSGEENVALGCEPVVTLSEWMAAFIDPEISRHETSMTTVEDGVLP